MTIAHYIQTFYSKDSSTWAQINALSTIIVISCGWCDGTIMFIVLLLLSYTFLIDTLYKWFLFGLRAASTVFVHIIKISMSHREERPFIQVNRKPCRRIPNSGEDTRK